MLKNTFVHIPGVGKTTERKIWQNNILSWEECIKNQDRLPGRVVSHIKDSLSAYEHKKFEFFNLPNNIHWRTYNELKNDCCFLDIETTGLGWDHHDITIIGIYNGKESKIFIKDKNMHEFEEELKKYSLVVTFNGRCFDIPFIQSKFKDVNFHFHADLRFALKELGYSGGLKRIENQLNLNRDDKIKDIDGWEAVRLWHKYRAGDDSALDLLVEYNKADIENLKSLMEFTYEKLREKEFLSCV